MLLKRKPEAEAGGLKITSFFVPLAKAPKKQAASKAAAAGQPPAEQPAPPAAAAAAEQPAAAPTAAGPGVGAQPRQPADFQRFALSRGGAPSGTTGTQRQLGSADGAARSSAAGAVPGAAASKQQLCADAAAEAKARQQSPQRPEQQQPQQQEGPAGPLAAAAGSPIGASCSPALPASAYAAAWPAAGQQAAACTVHAGGCEAAAGSSGAACSSGEGAGVAAAASGARSPDAAVAGPPLSPGEQQVGSSAGLEVAGGREVGASTGSESDAESERDGGEDGPTDYERAREERIRRNMEVRRTMGAGFCCGKGGAIALSLIQGCAAQVPRLARVCRVQDASSSQQRKPFRFLLCPAQLPSHAQIAARRSCAAWAWARPPARQSVPSRRSQQHAASRPQHPPRQPSASIH